MVPTSLRRFWTAFDVSPVSTVITPNNANWIYPSLNALPIWTWMRLGFQDLIGLFLPIQFVSIYFLVAYWNDGNFMNIPGKFYYPSLCHCGHISLQWCIVGTLPIQSCFLSKPLKASKATLLQHLSSARQWPQHCRPSPALQHSTPPSEHPFVADDARIDATCSVRAILSSCQRLICYVSIDKWILKH